MGSIYFSECKCKDLLNEKGYGKCQRRSKIDAFKNQFTCYVTENSSCSDTINSTVVDGEKYSAEACKDFNKCKICNSNSILILDLY